MGRDGFFPHYVHVVCGSTYWSLVCHVLETVPCIGGCVPHVLTCVPHNVLRKACLLFIWGRISCGLDAYLGMRRIIFTMVARVCVTRMP